MIKTILIFFIVSCIHNQNDDNLSFKGEWISDNIEKCGSDGDCETHSYELYFLNEKTNEVKIIKRILSMDGALNQKIEIRGLWSKSPKPPVFSGSGTDDRPAQDKCYLEIQWKYEILLQRYDFYDVEDSLVNSDFLPPCIGHGCEYNYLGFKGDLDEYICMEKESDKILLNNYSETIYLKRKNM